MMNINDLLNTNKPLHPVELEQANLSFSCTFANLRIYELDDKLYAFTDHKLEPFLNHYHTYSKVSQ